MRKIISTFILAFIAFGTLAQTNQGISHQAVIRNNQNQPVVNSQVGIRISILEGSVTGPAVYVETHTPATNENGLLTFENWQRRGG